MRPCVTQRARGFDLRRRGAAAQASKRFPWDCAFKFSAAWHSAACALSARDEGGGARARTRLQLGGSVWSGHSRQASRSPRGGGGGGGEVCACARGGSEGWYERAGGRARPQRLVPAADTPDGAARLPGLTSRLCPSTTSGRRCVCVCVEALRGAVRCAALRALPRASRTAVRARSRR